MPVLLLELSEQLRARGHVISIEWRRRDANVEADDLANSNFSKFNPLLRVEVDTSRMVWKVLSEALELSTSIFDDIVARCSEKVVQDNSARVQKARGRKRTLQETDPW